MPKKLRIGFDFDDVLIASADHITKLYNGIYGTKLTRDNWYEDQSIVEPWDVDDFSLVLSRVTEIMPSEDFMQVEPLKDAHDVLKHLKEQGHDLLVITGRPQMIRASTEQILTKYYGDIFNVDELQLTDHFAQEGKRTDKGDIALELALTHFVDDVIQHANSVASKGITTVLFDDGYKWNQAEPDHGVVRIKSWKALGEFFDGQAG